MTIRVALIGNPNVGKSLLFNDLTGGKAHVGNWPGKTVEKKEGRCRYKEEEIEIIDLPGTYSLTAHSIDELIARDYIVKEKPDVVVDIVDASNLERNLYLTLQLLELEANVVIALNKYDIAKSLGYKIDIDALSRMLGIRVVPTVATTKEGIKDLLEAIIEEAREGKGRKRAVIKYGKAAEELISRVEKAILKDKDLSGKYPTRWLAIKILEGDKEVLKEVERSPYRDEISEVIR